MAGLDRIAKRIQKATGLSYQKSLQLKREHASLVRVRVGRLLADRPDLSYKDAMAKLILAAVEEEQV